MTQLSEKQKLKKAAALTLLVFGLPIGTAVLFGTGGVLILNAVAFIVVIGALIYRIL